MGQAAIVGLVPFQLVRANPERYPARSTPLKSAVQVLVGIVGTALAAIVPVLWLPASSPAFAAQVAGIIHFDSAGYTILQDDGGPPIGKARYSIEHLDDATVLKGENRYFNGEYDVELDKLAIAAPGAIPALMTFEHSFFNADGSPHLVVRVNLISGEASCIHHAATGVEKLDARLDFPPDTYAGASILVAIEEHLRASSTEPTRLHVFACVPGPRVLQVEIRPRGVTRWALYSGELTGVDVRPHLGWWDFLLVPFVPKIRAWFDASEDFNYVGGQLQRYYRGPWVTLVPSAATPNPAGGKTRSVPPPRKQN